MHAINTPMRCHHPKSGPHMPHDIHMSMDHACMMPMAPSFPLGQEHPAFLVVAISRWFQTLRFSMLRYSSFQMPPSIPFLYSRITGALTSIQRILNQFEITVPCARTNSIKAFFRYFLNPILVYSALRLWGSVQLLFWSCTCWAPLDIHHTKVFVIPLVA